MTSKILCNSKVLMIPGFVENLWENLPKKKKSLLSCSASLSLPTLDLPTDDC